MVDGQLEFCSAPTSEHLEGHAPVQMASEVDFELERGHP